MTGERRDYTRGLSWRKLGGKRRKAWKDAYRRLSHGASGVVKLGRKPDPPFDPGDEESRQALVNLGMAILELRELAGLSATDLAIATGVPPALIAVIEDGQFDPDFELLWTLADGIGVRPVAIFRRAEELDKR